jgi:single-strand DNA-binding protein
MMKKILSASTIINFPASFHPVLLIQFLVFHLLLGVISAFTLNKKSIGVGRNGNALVFRSRQRTPSVSVSADDGNTSGPPIVPDLFDESMPICNQVVLVGRIGIVPEPRYLPDGKVVLKVGLAVKRQYNSYERIALGINYGEEETDWFTLEMWGKDAEFMAQYVTKGARVGISGSLLFDR